MSNNARKSPAMKPLRALLSTLSLSTAIVGTGVAAWALVVPADGPAGTDGTDHTSATAAPTSVDSTVSIGAPGGLGHGFLWHLTDSQRVLPGAVLTGSLKAHHRSRGTRSDRQFFSISRTGSNGIPKAALRAYRHAEQVLARTDPSCHMSWTLLAAIGRVESDHGRFGGAVLGSDGVSRPEIRGPRLNGAGAFAAIRDTDRGTLDHDVVWDRAVGPMQFLPQTWRSIAGDGDGDGVANPDDIDDSALGAAVYLCGAGVSVADPAGAARAAFRYNPSDYYVALVLSFQAGYRTGVFALPSPPPPPMSGHTPSRIAKAKTAATKARRAHTSSSRPHRPTVKQARPATSTSKPMSKPSNRPSSKPRGRPSSAPTPVPSPAPATVPGPPGPATISVDGTWNICGYDFCLGATALDLGPPSDGSAPATADLDGDGTVESNRDEFSGLDGRHVILKVQPTAGAWVVYVIDGHDFRNADGTYDPANLPPTTVSSAAP